MENPVYWYKVCLHFEKDSQKFMFKSDHLYEAGDRITKRYESGAVVYIEIIYGYSTAFPAHELYKMKNSSLWPPILSEI